MAYNFAAGNKRLSGNMKGYLDEKKKEHEAKSKALGKKKDTRQPSTIAMEKWARTKAKHGNGAGRDIDLMRERKHLEKKYPHLTGWGK